MMGFLSLLNPGRWMLYLAAIAALLGAYAWRVHVERDFGRAEVQIKWDAANGRAKDAAIKEAQANAAETARRLAQQKVNQDAQTKLLAVARRDAVANAAAADQLRNQLTDTARRWRAAISDSPTVANCTAAADAIGVYADLLGRADRRAGILAEAADAARIAGLQCEADYTALTK